MVWATLGTVDGTSHLHEGTCTMTRRTPIRRFAKPFRDFVTGLMLFAVFGLSGFADRAPADSGWITGTAHARYLSAEPPADARLEPYLVRQVVADPQPGSQQQIMALLSLAIAFSTVFAFNLWLARHVRRAHAYYRRRSADSAEPRR